MATIPRFRACLTLASAFALVFAAGAAHSAVRFQSPVLSQIGLGAPFAYSGQRWHLGYGDLDGDGRLDVVAPTLDSLAIYLGNGDGSFEVPMRVAIPTQAERIAVADFDHDGALDIAFGGIKYAHHDNPVIVLFGDGTGRHWTAMTLTNTDDYVTVLAGDFDGDGRTDLATLAIDPSNVHWLRTYLCRPGRTFEAHAVVQPTANPLARTLRTCDANEDGLADIATLTTTGDPAGVWVSRGDGTFQRTASLKMGATDFAMGDFDSDGHVDLIAFDDSDFLSTAFGRGDGTFGAVRWFWGGSGPTGAVGDLDGDGTLDVAYAPKGAPICGVRLGTGGGNFAATRWNTIGDMMNPLDLVDVDGDERLDFVGLGANELIVALGDGAGGLRRSNAVVPGNSYDYRLADFDGDGISDVASIDRTPPVSLLRVALGRPNRSFAVVPPITTPDLDMVLGTGDINQDGAIDVLVHRSTGQAVCFRGRGDGGLDSIGTFVVSDPRFAVLSEVTGDGHLDLVYATSDALHVMPGDGAGGFGPPINSPFSSAASSSNSFVFALGDLNGDGYIDAVLPDKTALSYPTYLHRCLGDGMGHFDTGGIGTYGVTTNQLGGAIGDVDGDGRDDLVGSLRCGSCPWTPSIWTSLQLPGGASGAPVVSPGPNFWGVDLADVDGDGHLDALASGATGAMVEYGDGSGRFGRTEGYGGPGGGRCSAADFDGDGHPDLVMYPFDIGGAQLAVFYSREFTPPTVTLLSPGGGATYGSGSHVLVAWQSEDDVATGTVDVFVSRHGRGGPFIFVAAGMPASGTCTWPVSGTPTDSLAFKVLARDAADNVAWVVSDSLSRIGDLTAVDAPTLPPQLELRSLWPNPVRDWLRIECALPTASDVTVAFHDVSGRRISEIARVHRAAGLATIDATLPPQHPGVLFVHVCAAGKTIIRRVVMVR